MVIHQSNVEYLDSILSHFELKRLSFIHLHKFVLVALAHACYCRMLTFCKNFNLQAIDDPSSKQFRDPPRYSHQPSMQQKVPFSLIRCCSSKVAFCSCVEWGWHIYNIVESESDPLTRRPVDLFEKEPLKGNSEVHLHTPTKFGEDRSKDLGGDREQTDRQTDKQTNRQTNAARFIVWWSPPQIQFMHTKIKHHTWHSQNRNTASVLHAQIMTWHAR